MKFDPIKTYLENSSEMINTLNEDMEERYKEEQKKSSNAFEKFEVEIMENAEFDTILNNSTFLTIYGLFEKQFLDLCLYCKEVEGFELSPKDIKGEGYIDQYRKFLTKLLLVNLDNLSGDWG